MFSSPLDLAAWAIIVLVAWLLWRANTNEGGVSEDVRSSAPSASFNATTGKGKLPRSLLRQRTAATTAAAVESQASPRFSSPPPPLPPRTWMNDGAATTTSSSPSSSPPPPLPPRNEAEKLRVLNEARARAAGVEL
jgi:hypothetical protein